MRLLVNGATTAMRALLKIQENRDHLGVLLTPHGYGTSNSMKYVADTGLKFALDNAAFSKWQPGSFTCALGRVVHAIEKGMVDREQLLWVACPDVVGDHQATMKNLDAWGPMLRAVDVPVAFVCQDGCTVEKLAKLHGRIDGIFIGGTDSFKTSVTACECLAWAKKWGKTTHMGRVNSFARVRLAIDWCCDSVDGSQHSWYSDRRIQDTLGAIQCWAEDSLTRVMKPTKGAEK